MNYNKMTAYIFSIGRWEDTEILVKYFESDEDAIKHATEHNNKYLKTDDEYGFGVYGIHFIHNLSKIIEDNIEFDDFGADDEHCIYNKYYFSDLKEA